MNSALVLYYLNLLAIQYKGKPKATALLSAVLGKLMIYDLIIAVRDGYALASAAGPQLDILAKYAGISRTVAGIPFYESGFGYWDYRENYTSPQEKPHIGAYALYQSVPPVSEIFFAYFTALDSYQMSDAQLQKILPARILLNHSNLSLADFDTALFGLFGESYDILEGVMSVTFRVQTSQIPTGQNAQAAGIFTPPMGVQATVLLSS